MEWDIRNDQPIYTQLIQQVTLAILSGTFPCGGRLPPVREMAAEAGVNPNTMQRALAELERTGLVYTQRTAGRFVTEDAAVIDSAKQELAHQQVGAFLRRMERMGYDREQAAHHRYPQAHHLPGGRRRPAGAVLEGGSIRDGYFRM